VKEQTQGTVGIQGYGYRSNNKLKYGNNTEETVNKGIKTSVERQGNKVGKEDEHE
jgi:hypothetical protein